MEDYEGVVEKNGKLFVDFYYQNKRYRLLYSKKTTETKKQKAFSHRKKVLKEIKQGAFTFEEWFPNSKVAVKVEIKTFEQLSQEWLDNKAKKKLSTLASYKFARNFWCAAFGKKLVTQIKTPEIKRVIAQSSIMPKTLKNYMVILKGTFDDALSYEWIVKSPCIGLDKIETKKPTPNPLEPEEVMAILALLYKQNPVVGRYYEFAVLTGIRPNEQIALTYDDVDFVGSRLHVCKGKVQGFIGTTKENTDDWVHLSPRALEIVKDARKEITDISIKEIFLNPNTGRPWADEKSQREAWWNPAMKKLGVVGHTAYDCRHTYASMLLTAGVPVQNISKQLGHASIMTTVKYYAKIIEGLTAKPLNQMNEALSSLSLSTATNAKKVVANGD